MTVSRLLYRQILVLIAIGLTIFPMPFASADTQAGVCVYVNPNDWAYPSSTYSGGADCVNALTALAHMGGGFFQVRSITRCDINEATPTNPHVTCSLNWTSYDSNNNILDFHEGAGDCGTGLFHNCGIYLNLPPNITDAVKVCSRTKMFFDSNLQRDSGQDCYLF